MAKPKAIKLWIERVFDAEAARNGGVVRRKIKSVKTYASEEALVAEVKRRGFHMVISGDQLVVLCDQGQFRVVC